MQVCTVTETSKPLPAPLAAKFRYMALRVVRMYTSFTQIEHEVVVQVLHQCDSVPPSVVVGLQSEEYVTLIQLDRFVSTFTLQHQSGMEPRKLDPKSIIGRCSLVRSANATEGPEDVSKPIFHTNHYVCVRLLMRGVRSPYKATFLCVPG